MVARLALRSCLLTLAACATTTGTEEADRSAPAFPNEAQLTISVTGVCSDDREKPGLRVTAAWSAAQDDVGVEAYAVWASDVPGEPGSVLVTVAGTSQTANLCVSSSFVLTVRAMDAAGNVSDGGPSAVVPGESAREPSWPEGSTLAASDVSDRGVVLTWSPASAAVAYRLYRDYEEVARVAAPAVGASADTGDNLSAPVDGLQPATEYELRIEAEGTDGELTSSGPSIVFTTHDRVGPGWPDGATIAAAWLAQSVVTLSWPWAADDVAVAGYEVIRDGAFIGTTARLDPWTTLSDLAPGVPVAVDVYAVDAAGNRSPALSTTLTAPDLDAPAWPTDARVVAAGRDPETGAVLLSWDAAIDSLAVTAYRIYDHHVLVATATTLGAAIVPDAGASSLILRVEAVDGAGNETTDGPHLEVDLNDDIAPTWPDGAQLVATDVGGTGAVLSWPPAVDSGSTGGESSPAAYRITRVAASNPSMVHTSFATGDTSTATLEALSPLTSYVISLVALDGAGNASAPLETEIETTDVPPPEWPTGATIANLELTPTTARVGWEPLTNASGGPVARYLVFVDDELVHDAGTATEATVTGLSPGATVLLSVEAEGPTGHRSTNGPEIQLTLPNAAPPEWPAASTLTASAVAETSATLTWTSPLGSPPVTGFEIRRSDALLATASNTTNHVTVSGLAAGSTVTLRVVALGLGGTSSPGPSTTFQTADLTAPSWPIGSTLTATGATATSITVTWSPATDNVAVASYRLLVDGVEAATTPGDELQSTLVGLNPGTTVVVTVRARDAAGNTSATGPALSTSTPGSSAVPTTAEVYAGLAPHCTACHGSAGDLFSTLGAFTTAVGNPGIVVPGQPSASLLYRYLLGTAETPLKQMPPSFAGPPFDALSKSGKTSLTTDAIRLWIEAMEAP